MGYVKKSASGFQRGDKLARFGRRGRTGPALADVTPEGLGRLLVELPEEEFIGGMAGVVRTGGQACGPHVLYIGRPR